MQWIKIICISIKRFGKQMTSNHHPHQTCSSYRFPHCYQWLHHFPACQARNLGAILDNLQPSLITFNQSPSPVNFSSTIYFDSACFASHLHLLQSSQATIISVLAHCSVASYLVSRLPHLLLSNLFKATRVTC